MLTSRGGARQRPILHRAVLVNSYIVGRPVVCLACKPGNGVAHNSCIPLVSIVCGHRPDRLGLLLDQSFVDASPVSVPAMGVDGLESPAELSTTSMGENVG